MCMVMKSHGFTTYFISQFNKNETWLTPFKSLRQVSARYNTSMALKTSTAMAGFSTYIKSHIYFILELVAKYTQNFHGLFFSRMIEMLMKGP